MTLQNMIEKLKRHIQTTQSTYEDFCLKLTISSETKHKTFDVTIEFESDQFDKIQVYGVIPNNAQFPTLAKTEDDEDLYRNIDVKTFINNCPWHITTFKIETL